MLLKKQHWSRKNIDIARARNIPISDILVHDFLTSPLFDGDFPVKPQKYVLVKELEKHIPHDEMTFTKQSSEKNSNSVNHD